MTHTHAGRAPIINPSVVIVVGEGDPFAQPGMRVWSSVHEASAWPALRPSDQGRRRRGETSLRVETGNSTVKDLRIPTLIPTRVSDPIPCQRGADRAGPGG